MPLSSPPIGHRVYLIPDGNLESTTTEAYIAYATNAGNQKKAEKQFRDEKSVDGA